MIPSIWRSSIGSERLSEYSYSANKTVQKKPVKGCLPRIPKNFNSGQLNMTIVEKVHSVIHTFFSYVMFIKPVKVCQPLKEVTLLRLSFAIFL